MKRTLLIISLLTYLAPKLLVSQITGISPNQSDPIGAYLPITITGNNTFLSASSPQGNFHQGKVVKRNTSYNLQIPISSVQYINPNTVTGNLFVTNNALGGLYDLICEIGDTGIGGVMDTLHDAFTVNNVCNGKVFSDANMNGIWDAGEQVLSGDTISLNGTTVVGNAGGFNNAASYRFPLSNNSYQLQFKKGPLHTNWIPTTDSVVNFTNNNSFMEFDFGIKSPTIDVSGHVFNDLNINGVQDPGESNASYAQIVFDPAVGSNLYANTNYQGYYSMSLPYGSWQVYQSLPGGYVFTFPNTLSGRYSFTYNQHTGLSNMNFGRMYTGINISGYVFSDEDNNGVYSYGDVPFANQPVTIDNNLVVYTNSTGFYNLSSTPGNHTLDISFSSGYQSFSYLPASISLNAVTAGITYPNNNFIVDVPPNAVDGASFLAAGPPVPGFNRYYTVKAKNVLTDTINGTLTIHYSSLQSFVSSTTTPTLFDTTNRLISWNTSNLSPGQEQSFFFHLHTPSSVPLGTVVTNSAYFITNEPDVYPPNDTTHLQQVTVGSYDPNDKSVSPVGGWTDGRIVPDEPLTYTIRFQNTGTAPAVNVYIVDTLAAGLDVSTFELLETSHPCYVTRQGNIVHFSFSSIMLPDSGSDYEASMGYTKFTIRPVPGLPVDSGIQNFADIYFDFNEPVRTNTVLNTIGDTLTFVNVTPAGATGFCSGRGDIVTINAAASENVVNYTWLQSDSVLANGPNATTVSTGSNGDVYLIVTDYFGNQLSSDTITVSEFQSPAIAITSPSNICTGAIANVSVAASGGTSPYIGEGSFTVPAGTYSYTVSDVNGCSNSASITIGEFPIPAVSISSGTDTLCAGDTALLLASGAATYGWSNGGSGASISVAPSVTTSYDVAGTDSNGCVANASYTINVDVCSGVYEQALNPSLIYPNPALDVIHLQLNRLEGHVNTLVVNDETGRIVHLQQLEGGSQLTLDVRYLQQGVYYLQLKSDNTCLQTLRFSVLR